MPRDQFSPVQAQAVAAAFAALKVDYMFIGKSGAILLGYPGTTQDVDVFPRKSRENGERGAGHGSGNETKHTPFERARRRGRYG